MRTYLIPSLPLLLTVLLILPAIPLPAKAQSAEYPHLQTPPLLCLSAIRQFGTVYLQWSVPVECPSAGFTVERTTDRVQHGGIASFTRYSITGKSARYSNIEPFSPEGVVWYRLRVNNRSGPDYCLQHAQPVGSLSEKRSVTEPSVEPLQREPFTLQGMEDKAGNEAKKVPVTLFLSDFSIVRQHGTVHIQWTLSPVKSLREVALERTTDQVQHQVLATYPLAPRPLSNNLFSYLEPYPPDQRVWYRLKLTDRRGNVTYSHFLEYLAVPLKVRLRVHPTPGPGNLIRLNLNQPPAVPLLVTIQDRLGFTRYQQWHQPGERLTVRLDDTAQTLTPGMYSAIVSAGQLFLKEKFIVE